MITREGEIEKMMATAHDLLSPRDSDACTIGGATGTCTRSGDPLIFSNSDDPFDTRTHLVVVEPASGFRFIATQIISPSPPVSFDQMHTRGLNSAGFAYTWSSVHPAAEPADTEAVGIPYYQLGRFLLSQCETVADAIELVERFPRAYHGNYLFADFHGELALVEISTQSFNVETRTDDGVIARANHWLSPQMSAIGTAEVGRSSTHRYSRALELITSQAGTVDVQSLAAIASDHAGIDDVGFSICAHGMGGDSRPRRGGTVSSEIIEPRSRRFWYCYGWPCGSAPEDATSQLHQERSWGIYLPFDLERLEPGEYVTTDGRLTPLAIRSLAPLATPTYVLTHV